MKNFLKLDGRVGRVLKEMLDAFLHKHVARSAAALAYYLTISFFPFLICVSAILGSLHIKESDLFAFMTEIFPADAVETIAEYLVHITGIRPEVMLVIGVTAMLTSSSAAFRSFTGIMGEIQGKMRYTGVRRGVFSFVFSIGFLAAIYVSGLVILTGEWLMQILEQYIGLGDVFELWSRVRFLLLFLLLFGIIFGIYIISAPREIRKTHRLPGAFAAAVVLVVASVLYSKLITASIKYALLYGSLASFIIMMIWLYTCGIILIMGNVFNVSLRKMKVESGKWKAEKVWKAQRAENADDAGSAENA